MPSERIKSHAIEPNLFALWEQVKERLITEIPKQSYLTWFVAIEPSSYDGELLTLDVPNQFHLDWVEGHYAKPLRQIVTEVFKNGTKVELQVVHQVPSEKTKPAKKENSTLVAVLPEEVTALGLNPAFTFESFIEGECNSFARAAAFSVAQAPGKTPYNPLLIYGASGLGKTHLIHAIGNYLLRNRLARKVTYVTSEKFTSDFIKAIQSGGGTDSFSKMYRQTDVFLVDDVQFFLGKDRTQEEFFHTFNSLRQAGKQLVFSSDRPPRELEGFDERMISRLQWGLVGELKKPELETRLAIVNNIAEKRNCPLPENVAQFIAEHVTDNIRSIEGAVTHIIAQSSLLGREVNLQMTRDALKNFITRPTQYVSIEKIQNIVADEYKIQSDLLRSKTRKSEIAFARQVAMYLCVELSNLTLQAIGLHFGGRDHATVIHAKKTIQKQILADRGFAEQIEQLKGRIQLSFI